MRGHEQTNEEDVYKSNPQLAHLLRTDFSAVIVGHSEDKRILYHLPPVPPHIYASVTVCGMEEVRLFTANPVFIRSLATSTHIPALEEVVAACLRYVAHVHEDRIGFLTQVGNQLAWLFPGDFHRVETILQRAWP